MCVMGVMCDMCGMGVMCVMCVIDGVRMEGVC